MTIVDLHKVAPANSRASRRGNTGGASVTLHNWALRVRRWLFKLCLNSE